MKRKKSLIVRALCAICAIGRGLNFFMGRKPKVGFDEDNVVVPLTTTYKLTVEGHIQDEEKKKPKKKKKTHNRGKYIKTKKRSTAVKLKTKKGRVIKIKAKRGK